MGLPKAGMSSSGVSCPEFRLCQFLAGLTPGRDWASSRVCYLHSASLVTLPDAVMHRLCGHRAVGVSFCVNGFMVVSGRGRGRGLLDTLDQ